MSASSSRVRRPFFTAVCAASAASTASWQVNALAELLVGGLRCKECRGSDSAGICTLHGGAMIRRRAKGKLANLAHVLALDPAPGIVGIAHTRWVTHGRQCPSSCNRRGCHCSQQYHR